MCNKKTDNSLFKWIMGDDIIIATSEVSTIERRGVNSLVRLKSGREVVLHAEFDEVADAFRIWCRRNTGSEEVIL